jgi:ABC-type spermidine/putrescine transport system permease subunit I
MRRRPSRWAGAGLLAPAYGLILVLVLVPLAALVVASLTPARVTGLPTLGLLFESYLRFFRDLPSRLVLANSLTIPALATLLSLGLGWPLAYALAKVHRRRGNALLAVLMAPFFVSYLLIIYAFMGLLQVGGPLQAALHALGLVSATTSLLYSRAAVTMALVYEYLPFMVLSIYGSLERIEDSVLEAASGLGAGAWRTFTEILWPRSVPGVIAGCALVFIPATGAFVEPQVLGGTRVSMLGEVINAQINQTFDLTRAATVSLVLTAAAVLGFAVLAALAQASRRALRR